MKIHSSIAIVLATAAVALPGIASANAPWHAANGEVGFTYHADQASTQRSRADVLAELEAAKRDGTLALMNRGLTPAPKAVGPARTRAEVIAESQRETPEQRRARRDLYRGG